MVYTVRLAGHKNRGGKNSFDGQQGPTVVPDGPMVNQPAISTEPTSGGAAGTLAGLPVYVDPQIPQNLGAGTNPDISIVGRYSDCWLWDADRLGIVRPALRRLPRGPVPGRGLGCCDPRSLRTCRERHLRNRLHSAHALIPT